MKWVFAALLFGNVVYWMWGLWYGGPVLPPERPPRADIAPQKLRLITEPGVVTVPRAPQQTREAPAAPLAPIATGAPGVGVCFTVGPFADVAAQTTAGTRLQELGLSYLERTQERQEVSHLLYLAPFSSAKAAEARRRQLTRLGITDHALLNDAAKKNAISLGLFRDPAGAQTRLRELAAKGVNAKLEVITRNDVTYWLDTHALAEADAKRLRQAWANAAPIVVNEKQCSVAPEPAEPAEKIGPGQ